MTDPTRGFDAVPLVAAGVLLMTETEPRQFLLMRHPDRWDLPKGHSEPGEAARETALREMEEETGLRADQVKLDSEFEYIIEYPVTYPDQPIARMKRVHYFIAWIDHPRNIYCTEHDSGRWFDWEPPHRIQTQTIDPLLKSVQEYLANR